MGLEQAPGWRGLGDFNRTDYFRRHPPGVESG